MVATTQRTASARHALHRSPCHVQWTVSSLPRCTVASSQSASAMPTWQACSSPRCRATARGTPDRSCPSPAVAPATRRVQVSCVTPLWLAQNPARVDGTLPTVQQAPCMAACLPALLRPHQLVISRGGEKTPGPHQLGVLEHLPPGPLVIHGEGQGALCPRQVSGRAVSAMQRHRRLERGIGRASISGNALLGSCPMCLAQPAVRSGATAGYQAM